MDDEDKSVKYFRYGIWTTSLVLAACIGYAKYMEKTNPPFQKERPATYQAREPVYVPYVPVFKDNNITPEVKFIDLSHIAEENKNLEGMIKDSLRRRGSIR